MTSERKILANRANALKSTGPITPEGKRKASKNATRHGLLAASIVLEGESLNRFSGLLAALTKSFDPQNCVETALIENMAVARWRQMRIWGMEHAHMAYEVAKQSAASHSEDILAHNAPTRASIALRTLSDDSRLLDVFNRQEARLDRQFVRALDRLEKIREKRKISKPSHNLFDLDVPDVDVPHAQ